MKRRILLVDDEVAILLTLKAVLEISGFQVDTAASAKEAKLKLKKNTYTMVMTDMSMESDEAGRQVIRAARSAAYHPAIALLTAFPVAEEDWQAMGADNMLVKPMQIQVLLQQIEALLEAHAAKMSGTVKLGLSPTPELGETPQAAQALTKELPVNKSHRVAAKKSTVTKTSSKKAGANRGSSNKTPAK